MQAKKGQINTIRPKKESACSGLSEASQRVDSLGLTCGFLKIQTGFLALEDPNQIGFMSDNYKNTEQ